MHKKIQGINTQLKKNNKEEYNKIFKQVTHPNQLIILNALVNSDALSKSIFGQTIDAVEKDKKYL